MTKFLSKIAPVFTLALFLFGVVAARGITTQTPAFNQDLTKEAITGGVRTLSLSHMYDEASYLFQLGYGYVSADILSFAGIENPGEAASVEVAAERYETARTYLEDSLRLSPADGVVWQFYAQSLTAVGDPEEAGRALEIAWSLAPNNRRLAVSRIYMIQSLRETLEDATAYQHIVDADKAVLEILAPRVLKNLPL